MCPCVLWSAWLAYKSADVYVFIHMHTRTHTCALTHKCTLLSLWAPIRVWYLNFLRNILYGNVWQNICEISSIKTIITCTYFSLHTFIYIFFKICVCNYTISPLRIILSECMWIWYESVCVWGCMYTYVFTCKSTKYMLCVWSFHFMLKRIIFLFLSEYR